MSQSPSKSSNSDRRHSLGRLGEEAAVERLVSEGFAILHRNWRCRSGELDIVASFDGVTVFIEVRTRSTGGKFGTAAESVDPRKQQQVRTTAEVYMLAHKLRNTAIRFDVIAITVERHSQRIIDVNHIEGAF
ncbi:YraN family protein [Paenibacillus oenotherae]|uniref:UPF0102 protein K0T92_01000 n=1 Tax=Paenibacillus oenotherae TaxID=1435645 RepID=A0ABS7D1P9_9BACL|nr:YraN family protein [Paenibacillus oenotherae]MBW7473316.1 YraN family protein [Paenibacillus oenotherae]